MTDKEFIYAFISKYEIQKGCYSCLLLSIQDARKITGRNIETGVNEFNILETEESFLNPNSLIGLINYLLVLEMIGEIFELNTVKKRNNNNIHNALSQFSSLQGTTLNNNEKYALIALRNCLAHNYGLVSIPRIKRENNIKRHKFSLDFKENASLVVFPENKWNGKFTNSSDNDYTVIGANKLIDLVEEIFKNLKIQIEHDKARIALKQGVQELKKRFTLSL